MHEPDNSTRQERALLEIARKLVRELNPQRTISVSPASRLDRDLGIDSLTRAELLLRIEQAFRVRLPEHTLTQAETIADLLTALGRAAPPAAPPQTHAVAAAALPEVEAASKARTLTEALDWHAAAHPDRLHITFLADAAQPVPLTYGALAQEARRIAAGLIARDVNVGDRVALMLPTAIEFFTSFFGVLYAGAVPVPVYPPLRLSQLEEHVNRQAGILRNAGARLLITTTRGQKLATLLQPQVPTITAVESPAALAAGPELRLPPTDDERATALLQYTSGSTGDPKGVVLSHANLLANIRAIGRAMDASSRDVFVSWLPLYHDMGLIGAWLATLYYGAPLYVMSPLTFLAHPESWLWAIHRYRATLSAAPNFAFETCRTKIDDADIEGLDLGSLRLVANGAEPVSANSIRRFTERFRAYGFRPEAMTPAYGLAENTVGLTMPPLGRGPRIDRVDRHTLGSTGVARPAAPADASPFEFVSCGKPIPDHEVRIVDAGGREVADRVVGRLEFRGPSATSGYFGNAAKTKELFDGDWLDSGDQAYRADGEIFITGRIKDLVIRAGRHIFPHEIEDAVAEIPGIVKNGVALIGTGDRASGTERVVIVAETTQEDSSSRDRLREQAQAAAVKVLGAPADEIVFVPPDTIPKTASGKIRRSTTRELYDAGALGAPRSSVGQQRIRLFLAGLLPRIRAAVNLAGRTLYAAWWWIIVAIAVVFGWIAVMTLPRPGARWTALRWLARAGLTAAGIPLTLKHPDRIPADNAILVFNHASYSDAFVLAAALPGTPVFAAKKEFADQALIGSFLRRLGVIFVERFDVAASLADAQAAAGMARGRLLAFFPEGTFTARRGLAPFRLGAFKAAAEAGLPVVPGAISGTRDMLRADTWWPRWTPVRLEIGEPIAPAGTDFNAIVALRNRARAFIAERCGEPDLDEPAFDTEAEAFWPGSRPAE